MGLKHILAGAALFTAGVLSSNTVRHSVANVLASEHLPAVSVRYEKSGTYVNGERIDSLGRVGGARCDWAELSAEQRGVYALREFQMNTTFANDYIAQLSTREQMSVAYRAVAELTKKAGNSVLDKVSGTEDSVGVPPYLPLVPPPH